MGAASWPRPIATRRSLPQATPIVLRAIAISAFALALTACHAAEKTGPFKNVDVDARTLELYARNCAICHGPGHGGAPKLGDVAAWAPRLAQGDDALLAHAIDGYNDMPPLGYCMDCDRNDLAALIRLMAVPEESR